MKNYLAVIFAIFYLSSCDKSVKKSDQITRIEIATGGCFGPCQPTIVNIDSSLAYQYYGGDTYFLSSAEAVKEGKLKGYYSARISQSFWDSLNIKLNDINYKKLDTTYLHSVDDQGLEVFIHYGKKLKHIKAQSASLPEKAAEVFYFIIHSYKTIKPRPTKDTFKFESVPERRIPMPDVKGVKFSPPTKEQLNN